MSRLQKKLLELCAEQTNGVYCLSRETFITYAEICDSSRRFGSVLGDKKQQVISVLLPNSIEYIEVMVCSFLTGNIFNPIPYFMSDQEVDRLLTIIGPGVVLTDRNLELTTENKNKIVNVNKLSSIDPAFSYGDSDDESVIASLYYSSGTTGNQKGVLYSHENVFELVTSICSEFKFGRATHHLSLLPFGHTASINYNILPCLFTGSRLTIAASFQMIMARFFQIVAAKQINYVQIVPSVLHMLMKIGEDVSTLDLSCLPFIGCGSAILPKSSQIEFQTKFGIAVANLYGLSETGPSHIDDPRKEGWKPGSIGVPLAVNECRIGPDSELLIKGKNLFVGYHNNKKLYEEVVKDDWFHTGDFGYFEGGEWYFSDRKKDLIIKSGINIVPAEIEEVLVSHSGILEVAIVGLADAVHGEEIYGAISLKNKNAKHDSLGDEVIRLLGKSLSSYKFPKKVFIFEELPKTLSGKVMRKNVRELIKNGNFESIY